jgi:hypothetical protein
MVCCFSRKKSRKLWRIWALVILRRAAFFSPRGGKRKCAAVLLYGHTELVAGSLIISLLVWATNHLSDKPAAGPPGSLLWLLVIAQPFMAGSILPPNTSSPVRDDRRALSSLTGLFLPLVLVPALKCWAIFKLFLVPPVICGPISRSGGLEQGAVRSRVAERRHGRRSAPKVRRFGHWPEDVDETRQPRAAAQSDFQSGRRHPGAVAQALLGVRPPDARLSLP